MEAQTVVGPEHVPVRLFLKSQDDQHDLVREPKPIELGDRFDTATTEASHRLASLVADALCRHGELLLLATRDEVRELRRGYVESIMGQLEER